MSRWKRKSMRMTSFGKCLQDRATPLHSDQTNLRGENYVVSFEGEIPIQAETQVAAENQAYDRLASLGQVTVMAFMQ